MRAVFRAVAAVLLVRSGADELSCEDPQWLSVYTLDAASGCPGDWQQLWVPSQEGGGDETVAVCGRGLVEQVYQASAIIAEGFVYDALRGSVVAYGMGSPDAFRPEAGRADFSYQPSIDAAYVDGIALARWTPENREHVATYAAGLSYFARDFWYHPGGNCPCHGGVPSYVPSWLGEDYYCDSPLRGPPPACGFSGEFEERGCNGFDECFASNCTAFFVNGEWYADDGRVNDKGYGGGASAFGSDEGYLCKGSRFATAEDFPGRPFGSFFQNLTSYHNDPIEARIMAGQDSGVAVFDEDANATTMARMVACRVIVSPSLAV